MFPHARQVFRIKQTVERRRRDGSTTTSETVSYGVTSLTRRKAKPIDLLSLRRGHWSIENKVHWRRDVIFGEDDSQVRSGQAPRAMASLRNLTINVLHLAGADSIVSALRHCAQNLASLARLLGISAHGSQLIDDCSASRTHHREGPYSCLHLQPGQPRRERIKTHSVALHSARGSTYPSPAS